MIEITINDSSDENPPMVVLKKDDFEITIDQETVFINYNDLVSGGSTEIPIDNIFEQIKKMKKE